MGFMRSNNIEMLQDTLQILEHGYYQKDGEKIWLKLSREEMEAVQVLLPDDVKDICNRADFKKPAVKGSKCEYSCENIDSYAFARKQYADCGYMPDGKEEKEILVLNLASPVHPGGGVRRGARAQEEDLCRKSSLLFSLESKKAERYYGYNRKRHTYMGSDALIFTPKVEILKDENGDLLDDTAIVAVLTCAAPKVNQGKEGMDDAAYEAMVYGRIMGMLKCAAYFGYQNLVLGAWGCGAYGNDARVISDLFYKAFQEITFHGLRDKDLFCRVGFAVLDHTAGKYNFREFYRNFSSGK